MFPEKIHIFANVPVDGGKKWIFPDEHDNSTYDNIASFCFEYDPDLPESIRLGCTNGTEDEICLFLSVNGQAAESPTHVPAAICGGVSLAMPQLSHELIKPIISSTRYETLGIRLIEIRVFKCSDIQHFESPAAGGEEEQRPDAKHNFCAPTPDQWNSPHGVSRMLAYPRGTQVPRSEFRKMLAGNRPLKPSMPPASAMAAGPPLGLFFTAPVV